MNMKDLYDNIGVVHGIDAQVISTAGGAKATGDVDLQGFQSAVLVINCGASGDTLDASDNITVKLEHADDPSSYSAVEEDDVLGATPSGGVVLSLDSLDKDQATYRIGYVGGKRYIKVTVTPNGTLNNGTAMALDIIKGHPLAFPVE